MPTLSMASKGQTVLPAALRRKLGMGPGARIEVIEEADGLRLRVVRPVSTAEVGQQAVLDVKALDTNVLARFVIDDPDDEEAARQHPAAVQALQQRAWFSVTVLLGFEWVMRGFYGLERADIAKVLQALCGVEHITLEDRGAVLSAMGLFGEGADFADALHRVRSAHAAAFGTFDRKLAKRVGVRANMPAVELLGGRG